MKKLFLTLFAIVSFSMLVHADEWCVVRGGTDDNAVTLSRTKGDRRDKVNVMLSHAEEKDITVFVKITNPNGESKTVSITIPAGDTYASLDERHMNIGGWLPEGIYTFDLVKSSCK